MKKIFLIEDDLTIAKNLILLLRAEGFTVTHAPTRREALAALAGSRFDLALIDISLPDGNGFTVCTEIKESQDIPVIFLTASGDEASVVTGLNMGADDYITKPFNAGELLARIRVALRHRSSAPKQEPVFELDTFKMDFEKRKVFVRGGEVHLTPIEYKMLTLLVNNSGKVLTHHFIQQEVWGYDTTDDYQSLRVFMANIRRKIEEDSTKPRFILTEVGVGYRFVES